MKKKFLIRKKIQIALYRINSLSLSLILLTSFGSHFNTLSLKIWSDASITFLKMFGAANKKRNVLSHFICSIFAFIWYWCLPENPCVGLSTLPWDDFRLHTHQQTIAMHTTIRTKPPMTPPTMAPTTYSWDSLSVSKKIYIYIYISWLNVVIHTTIPWFKRNN